VFCNTNTLTPWNEPPEFPQLIDSISSLPYGSNYIDFILENKILGIIEYYVMEMRSFKEGEIKLLKVP
jgi:hypothetical protein